MDAEPKLTPSSVAISFTSNFAQKLIGAGDGRDRSAPIAVTSIVLDDARIHIGEAADDQLADRSRIFRFDTRRQ